MHNEHYQKLEIDTIKKWKANKTLSQLIDACEFQIDKYNSRPKEGEEIKDCDKITFYSNLKKECYERGLDYGFELTFNESINAKTKREEILENSIPNLCNEFPLSNSFPDINEYETVEGTTFRLILGKDILFIGEENGMVQLATAFSDKVNISPAVFYDERYFVKK